MCRFLSYGFGRMICFRGLCAGSGERFAIVLIVYFFRGLIVVVHIKRIGKIAYLGN